MRIKYSEGQTSRDYVLDYFRIIAVLMVLSVHIRGRLHGIPSIIDKIFGLGAYGVVSAKLN